MKTRQILQAGLLAALVSTSFAANAFTPPSDSFHTIKGTDFGNGSSKTISFLGDVDATFAAKVGAADGKFTYKTGFGIYNGAGVSPTTTPIPSTSETKGEIDHNEHIDASFSKSIYITSFRLGLLFDGPEFGDVQEVAKITATYFDGTTGTFTFRATGTNTGIWSGSGATVYNASPATLDKAGVWDIVNPFANTRVKAISFGTDIGPCGSGLCNNQSDYTLISVSAVPEPETYGMMLAGLGLMGFVARRRKSA